MFKLFKRKKEKFELSDELFVIKLPYNQNKDTRQLWEEIFDGDSQQFVEYYYENIANRNTIIAARKNKQMIGMVHLNPYQIHLGRAIVPAHYIVGVCVKEEYRKQGIMKTMMKNAIQSLNELREPIAFIAQSKEGLYEQFGFVTAYNQKNSLFSYDRKYIFDAEAIENHSDTENDNTENTNYENVYCKELVDLDAKNEELNNLAKFAEGLLSDKYTTFACREYEYYVPVIKQFRAENGQMVMICEHQFIIGCFLYSEYDMIEIVDAIWQPEDTDKCMNAIMGYFEGKNKVIKFVASDCVKSEYLVKEVNRPYTMLRIINLDMFVRYIKADNEVKLIMKITDDFVEENNGVFEFNVSNADGESYITKSAENPEVNLSIIELNEIFFSGKIPDKCSDDVRNKFESMSKFDKVYINEYI